MDLRHARAGAAAILATLAAAAPAAADTGIVRVRAHAELTVREGPRTSAEAIAGLGNGQRVRIDCQRRGDLVVGRVGTSTVWDHVIAPERGFVADAFVDTDGRLAPPCGGGDRELPGELSLSDAGLRFIADYEGFYARAYDDEATPPNCTIGYGYVLRYAPCRRADRPLRWSVRHARAMLRQETAQAGSDVGDLIGDVPLEQYEYDALVSLAFQDGNRGRSFIAVIRRLWRDPPAYRSVPGVLRARANRETLPGLRARRRDEAELFASGDYCGDNRDGAAC